MDWVILTDEILARAEILAAQEHKGCNFKADHSQQNAPAENAPRYCVSVAEFRVVQGRFLKAVIGKGVVSDERGGSALTVEVSKSKSSRQSAVRSSSFTVAFLERLCIYAPKRKSGPALAAMASSFSSSRRISSRPSARPQNISDVYIDISGLAFSAETQKTA